MPRKVFADGEVLAASDVNDFLMDQSVMAFANSAARGSAILTPSEGMTTYNQDTNIIESWDGSAWVVPVPEAPTPTPVAILKVVSTTKTDTFTASLATGAQSSEVTGLTATITPTSISNKILVHISTSTDGATGGVNTILQRNGSVLTAATGDAAGSRTRVTMGVREGSGRTVMTAASFFLDSPATTSAVTYGVKLHNSSDITTTVALNRSLSDGDNLQIGRSISTITLMEVAG